MSYNNQESFNKLLETMIEYNVFTYGVTATGEKGYEYSNEFREWFLKCIAKAKSINYNKREKELFISVLMTFNDKITLGVADDMSCVIQGRNDIIRKKTKEVNGQ